MVGDIRRCAVRFPFSAGRTHSRRRRNQAKRHAVQLFRYGNHSRRYGGISSICVRPRLPSSMGGGIGYDFSSLRPKGALVAGIGADASGPVSFMDVWDAMCRTIMSAGHRRGAMMATLRCDHPDIEEFITAKQTAGRLVMFNLSVLVTDAFMAAVRDDQPWPLVFDGTTYKTLSARELWQQSCEPPMTMRNPASCSSTASTRRTASTIAKPFNRPTLRRTTVAALRRLPARIDQSGRLGGGAVYRHSPNRPASSCRVGTHCRADARQRDRRIAVSAGAAAA